MPARVLVVDDEVDVRELMTLVLEAAGYAVSVMTSAIGIVEEATASHPDLIVLDITMPEIDGLEALRLLKSSAQTRHIPVLMASAQGQRNTMLKARDLGASDFVVKPWADGELEWRVNECLQRTVRKTA